MAFLRINGWQIPVTNATVGRKLVAKGRRGRSFRGQMRDSRRYTRRSWDVTACYLDHGDASALEQMLIGRGHFIDFADGLQASTSLMPMPGYDPTTTLSPGVWGAFGLGVVSFGVGAGGAVLAYDAQLGDAWTVVYRRLVAGAWVGVAQRSDGVTYVGGTQNDAAAFPLGNGGQGLYARVIDGVVEIVKEQTSSNEVLDDLALLPYVASNGLCAALTAPVTEAIKFGPAPTVRIDGDIVGTGVRILADIDMGDTTVVQKPTQIPGFGWVNNARLVKFTILELDPAFVVEQTSPLDVTPAPPVLPAAWFDAGDVDGRRNTTLANGAKVATWHNNGRTAADATQATTIAQPTLLLSATPGLGDGPAVHFDGSNTFMQTAVASLSGSATVACVWRAAEVSATRDVLDRTSAPGIRLHMFRAANAVAVDNGTNTATFAAGTVAANQWASHVAQFLASSPVQLLDGVAETESVSLASGLGSVAFSIGAGLASGSNWLGEIAEILVWDAPVALADIEAYLTARYGAFPQ